MFHVGQIHILEVKYESMLISSINPSNEDWNLFCKPKWKTIETLFIKFKFGWNWNLFENLELKLS